LPERDIDPLYGDLITEDLKIVLFRTCGGAVDDIKRLILDKTPYEYCRGAALHTLTYAVVSGMTPREEALDFLGSLFTGQEDDNPASLIWTFAADAICDLYPQELMPVVEQAFAANRIDEIFFDLDYFKETLELGQEKTFERVRGEIASHSLDDIHKEMSGWAMFRAEEEPPPIHIPEPPKLPPSKKEKAQKKKKRKMAKASKKKNRSRK
jgi:hypothetical protein